MIQLAETLTASPTWTVKYFLTVASRSSSPSSYMRWICWEMVCFDTLYSAAIIF